MVRVIMLNVIMLSVITLNAIMLSVAHAECRKLALYAECYYAVSLPLVYTIAKFALS
jgi:hypothetical protein